MVIITAIVVVLLAVAVGIAIYAIKSNVDNKIEVPYVLSMTEEEAKYEIERLGLTVGEVTYEHSETVLSGLVINASPKYRTKVEKGTIVNLIVSKGKVAPKEVEVPSLIGLTQGEAEDKLAEIGLKSRHGTDVFNKDIAEGKVCSQTVEPGSVVIEGTTVEFSLSKGRETGYLPNVIGATAAEAEKKLVDDGFVVAYTDKEYSNEIKEGVVMKQSPLSGQAYKGDTVTLTVSLGPKPISMPSMIGKTEAEVRAELNRDYPKMIPVFLKEDATEIAQLNKVVRQNPPAGSEVKFDSTVTFYIGVAPASISP